MKDNYSKGFRLFFASLILIISIVFSLSMFFWPTFHGILGTTLFYSILAYLNLGFIKLFFPVLYFLGILAFKFIYLNHYPNEALDIVVKAMKFFLGLNFVFHLLGFIVLAAIVSDPVKVMDEYSPNKKYRILSFFRSGKDGHNYYFVCKGDSLRSCAEFRALDKEHYEESYLEGEIRAIWSENSEKFEIHKQKEIWIIGKYNITDNQESFKVTPDASFKGNETEKKEDLLLSYIDTYRDHRALVDQIIKVDPFAHHNLVFKKLSDEEKSYYFKKALEAKNVSAIEYLANEDVKVNMFDVYKYVRGLIYDELNDSKNIKIINSLVNRGIDPLVSVDNDTNLYKLSKRQSQTKIQALFKKTIEKNKPIKGVGVQNLNKNYEKFRLKANEDFLNSKLNDVINKSIETDFYEFNTLEYTSPNGKAQKLKTAYWGYFNNDNLPDFISILANTEKGYGIVMFRGFINKKGKLSFKLGYLRRISLLRIKPPHPVYIFQCEYGSQSKVCTHWKKYNLKEGKDIAVIFYITPEDRNTIRHVIGSRKGEFLDFMRVPSIQNAITREQNGF